MLESLLNGTISMGFNRVSEDWYHIDEGHLGKIAKIIFDQDIQGIQKEIAARQAAVHAVERFGTILSLPLFEYAKAMNVFETD